MTKVSCILTKSVNKANLSVHHYHKRIQKLKLGARSSAEGASQVEAPKASMGVGAQGEGSGQGAVPPPQKNFLDLKVKMAYFLSLIHI